MRKTLAVLAVVVIGILAGVIALLDQGRSSSANLNIKGSDLPLSSFTANITGSELEVYNNAYSYLESHDFRVAIGTTVFPNKIIAHYMTGLSMDPLIIKLLPRRNAIF